MTSSINASKKKKKKDEGKCTFSYKKFFYISFNNQSILDKANFPTTK